MIYRNNSNGRNKVMNEFNLKKKIWRVGRPFHDFPVWIAIQTFSDVDVISKTLSTLTEFVFYTNLVKNDFTEDAIHGT